MSRQDANATFARTSFLYGGNAAYIEDLQARYEKDPASVDAEWQTFFQALKDDGKAVLKTAQGASWERPNWPVRPNDDLTAALDGQWAEQERRIGDKIKKQAKPFQQDKPENYGQLSLKVTVPDSGKAYVVQLVNDKKTIVHSDPVTKNTTLTYKNYPVGKYTISVVYDSNKNGKWDSGNVKKKLYPENIWIYNKDSTLRSNWDAEETITVPKETVIP